jgi:UDP-N-acetylglucosamine:LPS N-acetylglucosamine transferase
VPAFPKILLLITDAGGGHRASANSLKAACEAQGAPLDVRIVNVYREVWQKAEPLGRFTGVYGEDVYNFTLKHSLLRLASVLRMVARLAANTPNPRALRDGLAFLRAEQPALCVSLMPFVNDTHARICAEAGVPFALVMTDLVDIKPYMWYTSKACRAAAWVAAPCADAVAEAREAGATRVLDCGLLLHPKYYAPSLRSLDRKEARRRLGLDVDRTTVLLSMGGFGGSAIEELADGLERHGEGLQIVAICGRNEELRARLASRPKGRHRIVPVGFTAEFELYLRAADLMAGKPGPASLFEAVAANTPLVLDAAAAMPQEAPNAALAVRHGLAISVNHRRDLPAAVAALAGDAPARAAMEAAQRAYPMQDSSKQLVQALIETAKAGT